MPFARRKAVDRPKINGSDEVDHVGKHQRQQFINDPEALRI
ncbi:hypothetical protein [Brevibacillus parabrevis]|nr:hypothetical protein [Brevibacillus parabrevis]MED1725223.1 hypothetical protein [Brevibacillus parabrevis]